MKKLLVLAVLFLAIAGNTFSQIASFSTTENIPFKKTSNVTAVCVVDEDFFLAFGEGEAFKVFFGSYRTEAFKYDTAAVPRTVRDCQEAADGSIVIVGDDGLVMFSTNQGKTWETIPYIKKRNYKLFVEDKDVWYFIPDQGATSCYVLGTKKTKPLINSGYILERALAIRSGFCIDGKAVFVATTNNDYQNKTLLCNFLYDPYSEYCIFNWTLENANDSIVSSVTKDGAIYNLAIDIGSSTGSYYKINTTEVISKESCNAVLSGDNFLPKGYVFPKGDGYFFGNDETGQAIKVDLSTMTRSELVCSLTKMTTISGKNNKVVIGGENGQVAISDYITEVDQNFDEEISLTQSGDQLAINGSDNVKWEIFSSLGSLITSGKDTKIETSGLESGMYIIKIFVGNKTTIKKFIV